MNPMIISFKVLRRLIGVMALSIAGICILGGILFEKIGVQINISVYYYTNMRDFLEGVLIGIGAFMICYYGYNLLDRIINTITGVFCIGIALFPTQNNLTYPVGIFVLNQGVSNILHVICASIFFALLGFICIFLFTKTDKIKKEILNKKDLRTPQKKIRNIIYIVCGIVILCCGIALGLVMALVPVVIVNKYFIVLMLEITILTTFGISWLIKGEILFKDK